MDNRVVNWFSVKVMMKRFTFTAFIVLAGFVGSLIA